MVFRAHRRCGLAGYRVDCRGKLDRHHIVNKSKSTRNTDAQAYLDNAMNLAWVCEVHNRQKWADSREARKTLLLHKVAEHGKKKVAEFYRGVPWKTKAAQREFRLEAMLV